MKKIFSLLLAVTATITAMAQGTDRTMLKVRLNDRTPIAVSVDGRYINRRTTSLTLDGLYPGRHRVEVYGTDGYRSRPVRIYTGTIRLEPGTVNIAIVDVYQRALRMRTRPMDEQRDRANSDNGDNDSRDGRIDDDLNDHSYNYPRNDRDEVKSRDDVYGQNDPRTPDNDSADDREQRGGEGYGSFPHGRTDGNGGRSLGSILSQRDMADLRSRVSSSTTDTDKEKLMKNGLDNRSVSTAQVREMLRWLSFESTRLDFAKWAYTHVTDKQNYQKLENAFDFSDSRKEFNDAVR